MDTLQLIGRHKALFAEDIAAHEDELAACIRQSRFLVIGGAGSIGQAVVREIFRRNPSLLHVVDISENNLVELVRDLRSTMGYGEGEFATFAIDCGSREFEALMRSTGSYDFVFNLSALKHVRSERDPFTLMRMIEVNVLNTLKSLRMARETGAQHYFCVSTDKAADPVNLMGASKRIMELFLMREGTAIPYSTARMANVAFSDGSLLHGFDQRFLKRQPLSAPTDVRRYFVTSREAGELCLMAGLLGRNGELFLPRLDGDADMSDFRTIAERYCRQRGFEPWPCATETETREQAEALINSGRWPCHFFISDTTGEKASETLHTKGERPVFDRFKDIGILTSQLDRDDRTLDAFVDRIEALREGGRWTRQDIVDAVRGVLPQFAHQETGKFLDGKM